MEDFPDIAWLCHVLFLSNQSIPASTGFQQVQILDFGEGLVLDRNTDICFSACVRTTLDIEENLYRRVKAKAAMEGRTVTELVEAGLRTVMETPANDSIAEPAWKCFAGVWSGPGWDKDKKLVDAEMEAAFGSLEPEDRMITVKPT